FSALRGYIPRTLAPLAALAGKVQAEVAPEPHAVGIEVDSPYPAPGRFEDLRRQQSDQSQADDGDPLADLDLGHAHGVQRNSAHGDRSRRLEIDPARDSDATVPGNS